LLRPTPAEAPPPLETRVLLFSYARSSADRTPAHQRAGPVVLRAEPEGGDRAASGRAGRDDPHRARASRGSRAVPCRRFVTQLRRPRPWRATRRGLDSTARGHGICCGPPR
jgi:hypothetical protein